MQIAELTYSVEAILKVNMMRKIDQERKMSIIL